MSKKFMLLGSVCALAMCFHTQAFGQDAVDEDDIIVTGTRVATANPSVPLTVITAEDIELRGISSVDQLLKQVSGNNPSISASNISSVSVGASNRGNTVSNNEGGTSVDLRGLGAGSTLVLVNGRRLPGEGVASGDFADISAIPVESIERVEILTSGASAIYGADAIAGVVNIILKKNYSGATVRARTEFSASGADAYALSGTFGQGWGSGNITGSISYRDQSAVSADKFGLTTRDFRSQGGFDRREFSSTRGLFSVNPFTRRFLDDDDPFATGLFVLPENSGGVDFDTFVDDLIFLPYASIEGNTLGVREILPLSLQPEEETFSINGRITQDVNFGMVTSFFAEGFYSKRDTRTPLQPSQLVTDGADLGFTEFGSPFFDDFSDSGFREDLDFRLDLSDVTNAGIVPPEDISSSSENISFNLGLIGEFAPDWTWEISGGYSENKDNDTIPTFDAFTVLSGIFDDDTFDTLVEPFNVIRNDFLTNPDAAEALSRVVEPLNSVGETQLISFQAIGRGKLFSDRELGGLSFAYGGEYREEDITASRAFEVANLAPTPLIQDFGSKRKTQAGFIEASYPLFERLELNGALRYEDVSTRGTTVSIADSLAEYFETGEDQFEPIGLQSPFSQSDSSLTWRLGGSFKANDILRLRATFGKSFRSPNAVEVGEPATSESIFIDTFVDPITGDPIDEFDPLVFAGNRNLKAETATTSNIGFVFTPSLGNHDFTVDFDYFRIDYKDRIFSSSDFTGGFDGEGVLGEPGVLRDADGNFQAIFFGPINVASEELSGLDISLGHSTEVNGFTIRNDFKIFQQLDRERQTSDLTDVEDLTGITQPETRFNYTGTVGYKDFTLTGNVNYTGDYINSVDLRQPVDSLTLVDLSLAYSFPQNDGPLSGVRLLGGVSNIFDTDPPFLNIRNGFSSQYYDLRRRVGFLEVRKTF